MLHKKSPELNEGFSAAQVYYPGMEQGIFSTTGKGYRRIRDVLTQLWGRNMLSVTQMRIRYIIL